MLIIVFVMSCVRASGGGLHGIIRWFKFILEVSYFLESCMNIVDLYVMDTM